MTRLLLSLLRLVAADRFAAQGANRGRSTGQYRRLVPATAESSYGRRGGYAYPDDRGRADRDRWSRGGARRDGPYDGDDFRPGHDGRQDGFDGDGSDDADDFGFADEPAAGDGGYVDGSRRYRAADAGGGAAPGSAGTAGYRHGGQRAAGAATSAAAGARAGHSGRGGRAAGRTGMLPPTERYTTEPFETEPFATEPLTGRPRGGGRPGDGRRGDGRRGDGRPLTGTVHRPDHGGRGPGSGWGGDQGRRGDTGWGGGRRPRRRRIPLRYKWIVALVVLALIFRRAVAWAVMVALSAALHLVGLGIHLPSVKFGWPWQSVASNSTTTTPVGPWVLQKIEGISKPALGRVNFNFVFTRKVSKDIGPWPCWYQSTFAAVGHASATVALNPGPAWWSPGTGHYQLRVLSAPQGGKPGHVAVRMTLPMPQLPQSAHDVTIDNLPSKPIDVQHSWTYPGFGCGTLLKPQFDNSVLYAEAQQIAYYKSTHVPQVTKPLVAAAETEAVQTVRDNFVQPTVNALGYTLDKFTIAWVTR